jgi:hypothetical protein
MRAALAPRADGAAPSSWSGDDRGIYGDYPPAA